MLRTNYYDIIIIGSGISGLYSAYLIQMFAPHAKILILEKHKKKWLGGRTSNEEFHGVNVVTGAGIGRKNKDYLLIHLLKELKIPFHEFHTETQYSSTIHPPCDVKKIFLFLILICCSVSAQTSYRNLSTENWTFNKQNEAKKHKATIPGTIHTDLFQNQLIPDPFFGANEKQLQWI
jgi:monoamine oxidase